MYTKNTLEINFVCVKMKKKKKGSWRFFITFFTRMSRHLLVYVNLIIKGGNEEGCASTFFYMVALLSVVAPLARAGHRLLVCAVAHAEDNPSPEKWHLRWSVLCAC